MNLLTDTKILWIDWESAEVYPPQGGEALAAWQALEQAQADAEALGVLAESDGTPDHLDWQWSSASFEMGNSRPAGIEEETPLRELVAGRIYVYGARFEGFDSPCLLIAKSDLVQIHTHPQMGYRLAEMIRYGVHALREHPEGAVAVSWTHGHPLVTISASLEADITRWMKRTHPLRVLPTKTPA